MSNLKNGHSPVKLASPNLGEAKSEGGPADDTWNNLRSV